jgi:membrane protein insertase Oxa1/YidC/SpoIIIJ
MLSSAGELYQQPMIPGWVDDLTATDPYYILPAILVVTMFIQAPATGDGRLAAAEVPAVRNAADVRREETWSFASQRPSR